MSMELQLLVWAVALTVVQLVVAIVPTLAQVGVTVAAGNREGTAEPTGLAGRAVRAHRNMLESLVLFAVLVLVAHVAGKSNAMTLMGAEIFVAARVAFALIYLAGIPWLRTGAWAVAMGGLVLMFVQLI